MDWREIYRRLIRERDDPLAWAALEQGVRAWARPDLRTRGWHVVDDAVADTCAAVVLGLQGAYGEETFGGFVRGHYQNVRRRALRDGRRPEVYLGPGMDVPDPDPEPGAQAGPDDEALAALRAGVAALPPRERAAVRLRYFEGRSSAETAAALGVTEGNARRILCLGLARLRRGLWAVPVAPPESPGIASGPGEAGAPGVVRPGTGRSAAGRRP